MTTSSEDVLLQMGEVRFKKGDGTLYVMNERLAWMAEHRDTVACSHRFQDIKMQKISPDGKAKIQLQLVLHDGNSSTFHFVNHLGQAAQLADRDKVKDLLQQLLPNFKRKADKELEEKNRILSENPNLLQLYKDLVITQVITSEEFWETHAKAYAQKSNTKKQEIGVSAAFLADIKPQTDGCNGLKYNLTNDIRDSIFKTYPAVKKKFIENVPTKLSESEFWTKFFQSHYFHRDRLAGGTKDIFSECGKIDDQILKVAVQQGSGDPLLDLRQFEDKALQDSFKSAFSDNRKSNSGNIVHQSMIKRFNQHSIMVLKTCTDPNSQPISNPLTDISANKGDLNLNGIKDKKNKSNNNCNYASSNSSSNPASRRNSTDSGVSSSPSKAKRQRLIDKIYFDDLGKPVEEINDDINGKHSQKDGLKLNLDKVERYLHGPVPISYMEHEEQLSNLPETQYHINEELKMWGQRTPHKVLVNGKSAVNALGELSPGGALMRSFQEPTSQLVPPEFEKDLRNLYLSLSELLKHFWSAFPPTTPELENRAIRMHDALQRFKMAKLTVFEDRAMRELSPLGATLTQHLNQLLQAAGRKFATWQERKIRFHR